MPQEASALKGTVIHLHEGEVLLPGGFEDRTTNLFVPANTERQPNLSIARDNLREDESLDQYVTRQIAMLKSRLAGHKVTGRSVALLGQGEMMLKGEQIDAQYRNGGHTVYQRQAAFPIQSPRVLIFSASCVRPFDNVLGEFWKRWLASFTPGSETPLERD